MTPDGQSTNPLDKAANREPAVIYWQRTEATQPDQQEQRVA